MDAMSAQAADVIYCEMKAPAHVGEVRTRSWQLAMVTGKEHESPFWADRARGYWERHGRRFGLRMSNFTLVTGDFPETGPVITTVSVVEEILPGRRVPGYRPDWSNA